MTSEEEPRRARLRNRRLAVAATLAGLMGVGALLLVLDGDGKVPEAGPPSTSTTTASTTGSTASTAPTAPTTTAPPTTAPPTTWSPPPDDPTQPSPAAVAADQAFRRAPDDLLDCGAHVRTSGWPTTFFPGSDLLDCILIAAGTGNPAQFVSTARDFVGGMEGTIFRVLGPSEVLVIDYRADPEGVITSTERPCTGLVVPNFPIPECA